MTSEREIHVQSREELIYLLAEAAEIEHGLMCCYLFAAFGLKTQADGLDKPQADEIARWKRAIVGVAIEEMTHLSLVANLTLAIGGSPHFMRPNFPVASGYHPSGVVVELHRFDRATLDHFIYLERPEGVEITDGAAYAHRDETYVRDMGTGRLMPSAQDYATVGHLYRGIRQALDGLCQARGEDAMFVGDPALQVGPDLANLPGLLKVTDRASALRALDVIVEQGEGSPADSAQSHYQRFLSIRAAYDQFLAQNPGFDPSRPVASSPVMRNPPSPEGKTFVDEPTAAATLDLANALYGLTLRALVQAFAERDPARKRVFLDTAIEGMFAISPVAEHLTTLPASPRAPGLNAGISFAMLRDVAPIPDGEAAARVLSERLRQLADGVPGALANAPITDHTRATLIRLAETLARLSATPKSPKLEVPNPMTSKPAPTPTSADPAVETVKGRDVTIRFDAKRCIHSRGCVLGHPEVYVPNVVGEWIHPDAASAEEVIRTGQNCPSGAIQVFRNDRAGSSNEPPIVNTLRVRENGPLAIEAELRIAGVAQATPRATLCRCGQSQNKPYCDGSHAQAGFVASGEPVTVAAEALAVRNGPVDVQPTRNGPLRVAGNLELVSGTGRTINRVTETYLCRCGQSKNKPYCDGSHNAAGFVAG